MLHMPLTLHRRADFDGLMQTLEIRRALEAEAAALMCRAGDRRKPSPESQRSWNRWSECSTRPRAPQSEADWEFHQAVYRASGNALFEQIIAAMLGTFHRFWEHPLGVRDFGHASFPYHRTMFERIAARDAAGARAEALEADRHRRGRSEARRRQSQTRGQSDERSIRQSSIAIILPRRRRCWRMTSRFPTARSCRRSTRPRYSPSPTMRRWPTPSPAAASSRFIRAATTRRSWSSRRRSRRWKARKQRAGSPPAWRRSARRCWPSSGRASASSRCATAMAMHTGCSSAFCRA